MISSGLMIAGLVVGAVAVVAIAVLARALRRRRTVDDRGIGATLPSGAVLNPSSVGPRAAEPGYAVPTPTVPTAPAFAPEPDTSSPSGAHPIPDDVVRLVSEGRTVEAVTALMNTTGRQDPVWAQRAVDALSTMDVAAYLADGRIPGEATSTGTSSTTTTSSTSHSISWSNVASRRGSEEPLAPGVTASSFSAQLPDEIIALVRQGRTAEAETRIRAEIGIGADQARHVVETIAKLPF